MDNYEQEYRRLRRDGLAGWGASHPAKDIDRVVETLDRLEAAGVFPSPAARVLDLGCGNGRAALLMAERGYEVHGIDISETAIGWARERAEAAGLRTAFRQGDVCAMPCFADGRFDVVMDGQCLHCLLGDARSRCLAEVHRILKREGAFVVSSMCGAPKSADARAAFDVDRHVLLAEGRPSRTLMPLEDLELELHQAGFVIEAQWLSINAWWDHVTMICRRSSR